MIAVLNLGHCDYTTALRLQQTLVGLRQRGSIPNVLLFVEHPPVITLGRNAASTNIVASHEVLTARGVEVFETDRGGDVTYHGPGQLVAYPIFDLRSFAPRLGAVDFVRRLEQVLMRICAQYRIESQRICGLTGLWTLAAPPPRLTARPLNRDYAPSVEEDIARTAEPWVERKIAAIGVHISRGVTSHGFALNVTTALDDFQLIVPCGLTRPVTSIEFETGLRPALEEVMTHAARAFGEIFASQVLWLESLHDLLPAEGEESNSKEPAPVKTQTPAPQDTPARAPENERRIARDDTHLA
jgi:lipoyl(octanoyl) transferase